MVQCWYFQKDLIESRGKTNGTNKVGISCGKEGPILNLQRRACPQNYHTATSSSLLSSPMADKGPAINWTVYPLVPGLPLWIGGHLPPWGAALRMTDSFKDKAMGRILTWLPALDTTPGSVLSQENGSHREINLPPTLQRRDISISLANLKK